MNYFGIDSNYHDEAYAGVDREGDIPGGSGSFLISMKNGLVEMPVKDDGTSPKVTLTEIGNIGRFVAVGLELER